MLIRASLSGLTEQTCQKLEKQHLTLRSTILKRRKLNYRIILGRGNRSYSPSSLEHSLEHAPRSSARSAICLILQHWTLSWLPFRWIHLSQTRALR